MKFTVKDHLLYRDGVKVKQIPSPNHGGRIVPRIIVIHYDGTNGTGGLSWLTREGSGVSAHFWISKKGEVIQLLKTCLRGWHAGKSEWDGKNDVNSFSIGIECQGTGSAWPNEQVETIRAVCEALSERYEIEDIVGHEDIAIPEGRKADPGPNFPWDKVVE